MTVISLAPVSSCCGTTTQPATIANPVMSYDSTLGDPNSQGITPPFTNLVAHIDEINGVGAAYVWNPTKGAWN